MDLSELQEIGARERRGRKAVVVRCCTAAGCLSSQGGAVKDTLAQAVESAGLGERIHVSAVGCMRLCGEGPLVQVDPDGPLYEKVSPAEAPSILAALNG